MKSSRRPQERKGTVLILTACMMVGMFALLALAIDLGYLHVARTELQRSADAAAIAATWELIDEDALAGYDISAHTTENARATAAQYALMNKVVNEELVLGEQDVAVGYLLDPSDRTAQMLFDGGRPFNAVRVRVQRTADQNGEIALFFAPVLGFDRSSLQAEATAALLNNFLGFQAPSSGDNLKMLPFALDSQTYNDLLARVGDDNWTWDKESKQVTSGPDSILEVNLYPQGTGPPGNRGTVDIGSSNNSTADIARQILYGISPEDLQYHGGKLQLDDNGELTLNGDTGISAGVKDELEAIIGQPRIIPIFSQVVGPGNNAQYTIVQFAGVRILEVKLTGNMSSKRVIVQPANVITCGGIAATNEQTSHFIYSPVWLVR